MSGSKKRIGLARREQEAERSSVDLEERARLGDPAFRCPLD